MEPEASIASPASGPNPGLRIFIALIIGALVLAVAVTLASHRTQQYQLVPSGQFYVRLNTVTGETDVCLLDQEGGQNERTRLFLNCSGSLDY